jgi:hypothetical protein
MARVTSYGLVIAGAALLASCGSGGQSQAQSADGGLAPPSVQLVFNEEGQAALPKGYRSWVHAYTSWESITTTILDGTVTETPEFHSVYVEPNAYRTFMRTGNWPEGTLMVKEFSTTSIDPDNCDGPPTYPCKLGTATVIFPQERTGIGVMLKDSGRFPGEPGGWAYFSYGHQAPPYQAYSPARDREQCAQCHIDNVGPKNDYVWSVELNQPGFRRADGQAEQNLEAALGG